MRYLKLAPARAAHAAAYALSINNRPMGAEALLELLRAVDAEADTRYGEPITHTKMPAALIRASVLRYVTAPYDRGLEILQQQKEWRDMICRSDGRLRLRKKITNPNEELGELSEADMELLHEFWARQQALTPPIVAMR